MTKLERIAELQKWRGQMVDYARMKLDQEDWHGLADSAMDLRDIDNELAGLTFSDD